MTTSPGSAGTPTILLFYKYVRVPDPRQAADEISALGDKFKLRGRVLLAEEGINGNLEVPPHAGTAAFVHALERVCGGVFAGLDVKTDVPAGDFAAGHHHFFPDFVVKTVREICSTGGIPFEYLEQGLGGTHLSPHEFHDVLEEYWADPSKAGDLVVIDVRNTREVEMGRFMVGGHEAMDSDTRVLSEWPELFAKRRLPELKEKKVLMYCTGGIRCEKASALLRSLGCQDVSQLSGGIHRYLEEFGDQGHFRGLNFAFDKRGAQGIRTPEVLGKCAYCQTPHEEHSSDRVCAVCRDSVLVCDSCRLSRRGVYFCKTHRALDGAYFPFLDGFDKEALQTQAGKLEAALDALAGVEHRNRRRTIRRQLERVRAALAGAAAAAEQQREGRGVPEMRCRACLRLGPKHALEALGESVMAGAEVCDGRCTGYHQNQHSEVRSTLDSLVFPVRAGSADPGDVAGAGALRPSPVG